MTNEEGPIALARESGPGARVNLSPDDIAVGSDRRVCPNQRTSDQNGSVSSGWGEADQLLLPASRDSDARPAADDDQDTPSRRPEGRPAGRSASAAEAGPAPTRPTDGRPTPANKVGRYNLGEVSCSVDWLTLSADTREACDVLLSRSTVLEIGNGSKGYQASERRRVVWPTGGCVGWRSFMPFAESAKWGKAFESWEFSGDSALLAASQLRSAGVWRRVDAAWDFRASVCPRAFLEALGVDPEGDDVELVGRGGRYSAYVGARSSPLRVRIYRRDWRHPVLEPVLRIEVILRKHLAELFQGQYHFGEAAPWEFVRGMMADRLGGWHPDGEVRLVEVSARRPDRVEQLAYASFLRAYSAAVTAWSSAGVDVHADCASVVAGKAVNRMQDTRLRRRVEAVGDPAEFSAAGVALVLRECDDSRSKESA